MSPAREPLQSLSTNTLPTNDSTPSTSKPRPYKLAPIFTDTPRASSSSTRIVILRDGAESSSTDLGSPRKRVKREVVASTMDEQTDEENDERPERLKIGRKGSMMSYFGPATPIRDTQPRSQKQPEPIRVDQVAEKSRTSGLWRRKRARLGVGSSRADNMVFMSSQKPSSAPTPFLSTLWTSTAPYHPDTPPSFFFIPSQHPPYGRPREFSPPLTVAFNSVAKHYDAMSAREMGLRRMLAVGGEEGGVRILDVDEGMGIHREEKGWWWRAHGNAVFDVKFSADDTKILTASGDQTTRIHTLDTPVPRLQAILRGHTSSIKTTVFFDPSRSHLDPSVSSSVVASGGRDGNILIYDLRCQAQSSLNGLDPLSPTSRRSRSRYSEGISGFSAQMDAPVLEPVMTIKSAHGDGTKRSPSQRTALQSVTSLVAMQSMPGMLASGGSYDGVVKLWDLRFPGVTERKNSKPSSVAAGSLPDPTIHCANPSRRSRSVNALVESPTTGDLFALCGDSKIHRLRPAYASYAADFSGDTEANADLSAIIPGTYTDPNLLVSSFYIRASISPDGKRLACGSGRGGLMTWDVDGKPDDRGEIGATRLSLGVNGDREVSAIDWGHDMLAACADDLATRIWRSKPNAAELVRSSDWWGQVA